MSKRGLFLGVLTTTTTRLVVRALSSSSCARQRFCTRNGMRRFASIPLHDGSRHLPPMVQTDGRDFGLPELEGGVVRPPDPDSLWEWYVRFGLDAADPDPSWARVWPTAIHLASRIGELVPVEGRSVVEIGCGLGVCGLIAAKRGAARVTLVDREPFALHCAMATASLNGLETRGARPVVSAALEDFSADGAASPLGTFDLVLASDVMYDPAHMAGLVRGCERLVGGEGVAFMADPTVPRAVGARAAFCAAARERGAIVTEVPFPDRPGFESAVLITAEWRKRQA